MVVATDMAAVRDDIPKEDQADKKPQDDEKPKIDPAKDENRFEANADKNRTGEKAEAKRTPVEGENEEKKKVKDKPKEKDVHVKCTSAEYFRVQPPFGFIKPMDTARIRVWFQNRNGVPTDGRRHYFALYFMSAPDGKKTIKDLWHKNARQEGICRINAVFERIGDHSPEARSADCKTSKEPDK
ncbi:MSP domain protein [Necator americanus]|uniref:Major sperm protein n=1 Tax=Necator americanus TaxID=51031 RepID=W2TV61_NECAM|nr:MSP domain protein [Necator americanus]ETN85534.1 MSP domain protein [Necator americanus]